MPNILPPYWELPSLNLRLLIKKLTWTIVNNVVLSDSDVLSMNMILELLYFKQKFGDAFSKEEIDFMIEYCCIS